MGENGNGNGFYLFLNTKMNVTKRAEKVDKKNRVIYFLPELWSLHCPKK